MQTFVAGPRAGLSRDVVAAAYQTDALTVGMGAELVRPTPTGYQVLADLSEDLAGGTIERDCLATLHGTCKLQIARDLQWGSDRVRPYMTLSGPVPAGLAPQAGVVGGYLLPVRWNLGVYLVTTPTTSPGLSVRTNQVTGYDPLWFLQQPIGDSYSLPANTPVLDAVRAVIAAAPGASSVVLLDNTAAAKTTAADMTWVLEENKQPTYLDVANELLALVAYRDLWTDEEGTYRSEPYVPPAQRTAEYAHNVTDQRTSLVSTERTQTLDTFQTPNEWRFVQKGLAARPTKTDGTDGLYVVQNTADGPTSINQRGFIKRTVIFLDAADAASLRAQGDQRVATDRLVTRTLTVKTAPMPGTGHLDVYTYRDDDLGGQLRVQAQKWSLDLEGADMSQTWQVIP